METRSIGIIICCVVNLRRYCTGNPEQAGWLGDWQYMVAHPVHGEGSGGFENTQLSLSRVNKLLKNHN
jgi:hypothetical protein